MIQVESPSPELQEVGSDGKNPLEPLKLPQARKPDDHSEPESPSDDEEESQGRELCEFLVNDARAIAAVRLLADGRDYTHVPWRNGLGESVQIAVRPADVDWRETPFLWSLTRAEIRGDRCSFSRSPGYDMTLVLLPPELGDEQSNATERKHELLDDAPDSPRFTFRRGLGSLLERSASHQPRLQRGAPGVRCATAAPQDVAQQPQATPPVVLSVQLPCVAILQHSDRQDHTLPLNALSPYTFDGAVPTTMHSKVTSPLRILSLMVRQDAAASLSTSIHTLCSRRPAAERRRRSRAGWAKLSAVGRFLAEARRLETAAGAESAASGDELDAGDDESGAETDASGVAVEEPVAPCGRVHATLVLSTFWLLYAVQGDVRVSIELGGRTARYNVRQGATLLVERTHRDADPIGVRIRHVPQKAASQHSAAPHSTAQGIQHSMHAPTTSTIVVLQLDVPPSPATGVARQRQTSVRLKQRGSILIVDDDAAAAAALRSRGSSVVAAPLLPTIEAGAPAERAKMYHPPTEALVGPAACEVPPPVVMDCLVVDDFPRGCISTAWINMTKQGLSEWIRVPVIVARGLEDGPVLGITAAMHGNELNGVPCIHKVVASLNVHSLRGTVVAVPCVNVPGYLRFQREFSDGRDLNRLFPGQPEGTASQVYCHMFMCKIVQAFNYHIDLHTASFGRCNSYYVRADMNDPATACMATLQRPQIILHNSGQDGTLRSAAAARGIRSITVEIGNPQLFQTQYVEWAYLGVMRILEWLGMFSAGGAPPSAPDTAAVHHHRSNTILCSRGFWMYTRTGGVLEVYPDVNSIFRKGDVIGRIRNIFGTVVDEITAPSNGIAIGKSSNPVAQAGDRILHVGVIKRESDELAHVAKENY